MARPARTAMIAALGAISVAALSACGGEDAKLLPGHTAREITANLEAVQQLSDEGDCVGAEGAATQVSEQIEALGGVDRKLKEALADGAERLSEVVEECEEAEEPETVAPAEVTPEEPEEEAEEAGKKAEKEEEKAEKEREKEEHEEEKEAQPTQPEGGPGPSEGPPGQEKTPPGQEKKEAPSGGVESANPAEGEQGG